MKLVNKRVVEEEVIVNTNVTADLPQNVVKNLSAGGKKKYKELQNNSDVVQIEGLPKTVKNRIVFLLRGEPRNVDELVIAYYRVFGATITPAQIHTNIYLLRQEGIVNRKAYSLINGGSFV